MLTSLLAKSLESAEAHCGAGQVIAAQRESLVVGLESVPPLPPPPSVTGAAVHAVIFLPGERRRSVRLLRSGTNLD